MNAATIRVGGTAIRAMRKAGLAFLFAVLAAAMVRADAALQLAADGRALMPVVISEQASAETTRQADELARYLSKISGAKFAVEKGDGTRGIVLGTLAEFPGSVPAGPLEIRNTYDGREAFSIRTEAKRLLLVGATDLAVPHAAMRLLETLGCRWFFPAQEWEVVPSVRELSVSIDVTDRPRILSRRIAYGYGSFRDKGHPRGGSTLDDYNDWARHNCMASSFTVSTGHAWQAVILGNKQAFADHPEYLALVKGRRQGPQLCVSNPEARRLATEWALAFLAKNPGKEMVSMECSDGHGQCECDECAKLGGIPDRVFGLVNHVAREVRTKHPGKFVGTLAYGEHSEPPSFDLEPNVYVQLTAGFIEGRYTHDELLDLWPKRCRNLGFYEYFSVWLWDFDRLPGGRVADITKVRDSIQRYAKIGGTSFLAETGNNWGVHGRGMYIANRLLWNPDADVAALLTDFYDRAFGPAAPAMRRYYERIAPDSNPLMSRSLIGVAFRDVEEATRLAKDRPDVLARLDPLKHYLRYVHLRWQLDHGKDRAKQKELTVAAITGVYRTRYEYMNHWGAMRQTFAEDSAKKFGEPTWLVGDKSPKPWMVEQPVTREETEQWFHEGLEYFQPKSVPELAFSNDLVPAGFADPSPAATRHSWQRPMTYAMHSPQGEPLQVEFTTGVIAHYRNRAAARWTLRDGAKTIIASGTLPQDGEAHLLNMKVPGAGMYWFEGSDSGAGWTLKTEPGVAVTLPMQRGKRIIHLGQMPATYFFVPKGTRELNYFWSGGPHKLLGPDRKIIADVKVDDEIVTVPVPVGMDGKVWSFSPRAQSELWFFNAPNYLASSPAALLLPREVVR